MERLDGEQALQEVLEDVGLEPPLEGEAAKPSVLDRLQGFSPHLRLLGVFVLGLLVGWFVLGWWIWPVRWTNTDPWDLREEHQIHFLMFLAEDYWYNADIRQVQKALDGWDRQALEEKLKREIERRFLEATGYQGDLRSVEGQDDALPVAWVDHATLTQIRNVPKDAWLLLEGIEPGKFWYYPVLGLLLVLFALYNLWAIRGYFKYVKNADRPK